jgi:uncharacterized membrane protein
MAESAENRKRSWEWFLFGSAMRGAGDILTPSAAKNESPAWHLLVLLAPVPEEKCPVTVIDPQSTSLLWAVILALAGFGFWAEQNTRLGRLLTGIIVAMAAAMLLANIRIIPNQAPVYDTIFSGILPLAIPLLLFRADLRHALRTGGPTIWAFGIGSVGVVAGVMLATTLVPLGGLSAVAGGLYTATYTGGSANFAAVAIATNFDDGSTLSAMVAADVIATNIQTMVLIALPGIAIVHRVFGAAGQDPKPAGGKAPRPFVLKNLDMAGISLALAVAFVLVALGERAAEWAGIPSIGILVTSALALLVANLGKPLVSRMSGDFELGTFLIFLFLIAVAAGADVWVLAETGPIFMIYTAIVLTVHTLFLLAVARGIRRWVTIDIRAIVIGSTACVGGVTTASAIASAKGWRDLIIPGIMAGTLGNALGSFIGVWVWSLLN